MSNHLPPSGQRTQEYVVDERDISPETLEIMNQTLNHLFDVLPVVRDEEEGEWHFKAYNSVLLTEKGYASVSARVLYHKKFGLVQRPFVTIHHGKAESGLDMMSDFMFSIEDMAIHGDAPLTIDGDNGNVIAGTDERLSFHDNPAIDARAEELLGDSEFHGSAQGVVLPNFQKTPSGEIYQDGSELANHVNPMPELATSSTISFSNDEEAIAFQRQMAAYRQATKDVGTHMTEGRALRVVALAEELIAIKS